MIRWVLLGGVVFRAWDALISAWTGPHIETWQMDVGRAAGNALALGLLLGASTIAKRWTLKVERRARSIEGGGR